MTRRERARLSDDGDVRRLLRALVFFCVCLAVFVGLRYVGLFH